MYGLAQPLGHPVILSMTTSSPSPSLLSKPRKLETNSGMRRSASATARPQRGRAGQAMERRVSGSTSAIVRIPHSLRIASTLSRCSGSTSLKTMLCDGERIIVRSSSLTILLRAVLIFTPLASLILPCSTLMPKK